MVEKVIDGKTGHPTILLEKVAMVMKVIPVKFGTKESAEQFVREHAGRNKNLPHRFDIFWCIISETSEERAAFKFNLMPLMKVKRAICETMQVEGTQLAIGNADKKVFCINGTYF